MQNLLNFINIIFWLSLLSFITNFNNFIKILFFSELSWVIFYCFLLISGCINDDVTILSSSIFVLGLAGIEYSIGILILIIFNQINKNTNFSNNNDLNNYNIKNNNNIFINKYVWKN